MKKFERLGVDTAPGQEKLQQKTALELRGEKLRRAPGVMVRPTQAGSYLFPKLPPLDVSIGAFAKILRELAGVTVTPGTEFGPAYTDSFRINFSQDAQAASQAIDRLLAVMERYRKQD